uniref:Uncharacterized protein n=1 Tax=Aegilops tauschii TaxID=37682 RepID=M8C031_AEGTA
MAASWRRSSVGSIVGGDMAWRFSVVVLRCMALVRVEVLGRNREREHHDCHGLNYFAEILEKLNGIILLIGNLGIDFSPEKVDRGSDNGRNTAAREEIIIWKIVDEEEAKVGRSIEQEFQTQTRKVAQTFYCRSRCSRAIAASNFIEDGHEWMFWLQVI